MTVLSPEVTVADSIVARYQLHKARWASCTACPLHANRSSIVYFRGQLPCDILFVGEAPGETEDIQKYPFVGPAGEELDNLLEKTSRLQGMTYGITNIVACIPIEHGSIREPALIEVETCRERLEELISLAEPTLYVALGKFANRHLPRNPAKTVCQLVHPAHIIREKNMIMREMLRKRFVSHLNVAIESTFR